MRVLYNQFGDIYVHGPVVLRSKAEWHDVREDDQTQDDYASSTNPLDAAASDQGSEVASKAAHRGTNREYCQRTE